MTGDTRVIPIMEHKDDEIQWECRTYISTDDRMPDTLKESMTSPNGHLWKMSAILEVKNSIKRGLDSDKDKRCKS